MTFLRYTKGVGKRISTPYLSETAYRPMHMLIQRIVSLIIIASFLVLAGGCGTPKVQVQRAETEMARDNRADKMQKLLLQSATRQVDSSADYRIGPEDVLEIEVFQAEELKKTVRVSSQGYIGLPLVGRIKAKDLTPPELEQEIGKALDKYMQEPVVTVYVKEYKAQKISVLGAVNKPDVYAVTGQRYLLDMLGLAGGLKPEAGTTVYVLRPVNQEKAISRTETLVIDLEELIEKSNISLNIPVFSGDVVNVPKGGIVFVDGAVNKPGAYVIDRQATIAKAIALAGGYKFEADTADVRIYRMGKDGQREVITASYDAITSGEKEDIPVRENDIVILAYSGMKVFFSGFISTIKGFVSFSVW